MKALDLSGHIFHKLTAVERVAGAKPIKWRCRCECGNFTEVLVSNLKRPGTGTKSCGCYNQSPITISVGEKYPTGMSGDALVLEELEGDYILIQYEDGTKDRVTKGNLRKGAARNPNLKVVYGVGYHGVGPYEQHNVKAYEYWYKMLQRAYCPEYKAAHPTYQEVTVADEWHNYQNFAEWCHSLFNYGPFGMNLDKDILVRGNKVYCKENCTLVPQHVNKVIAQKSAERDLPIGVVPSGEFKFIARCNVDMVNTYLGTFDTAESAGEAYIKTKEVEIKKVATKYKDQIDPKAYEALMNYTVEITD